MKKWLTYTIIAILLIIIITGLLILLLGNKNNPESNPDDINPTPNPNQNPDNQTNPTVTNELPIIIRVLCKDKRTISCASDPDCTVEKMKSFCNNNLPLPRCVKYETLCGKDQLCQWSCSNI